MSMDWPDESEGSEGDNGFGDGGIDDNGYPEAYDAGDNDALADDVIGDDNAPDDADDAGDSGDADVVDDDHSGADDASDGHDDHGIDADHDGAGDHAIDADHDGAGEPDDVADHADDPGDDAHDDVHVEVVDSETVGVDPDANTDADDPAFVAEFPPDLDLESRPEPVDGAPWSDADLLGSAPDHSGGLDTVDHAAYDHTSSLDDLFAMDGAGSSGGGWDSMSHSSDPAVASLARWWQP